MKGVEHLTCVKFNSTFENGYATLFISGSEILARSVNLLPKFYAAFRELVREKYNLDACANFYAIGTQVKCTFILNVAYAENKNIEKSLYIQKFENSFPFWVIGFETMINSILFDIEHADKHSEESEAEIRERIFNKRTEGLKYINLYNDSSKKIIDELRAKRKQAKKARKAEARRKKAAQQNSSHKD